MSTEPSKKQAPVRYERPAIAERTPIKHPLIGVASV